MMSSADFFKLNQLFRKILSRIPSECQTFFERDLARRFVGLGLNLNCKQTVSADDTRQSTRVHVATITHFIWMDSPCI